MAESGFAVSFAVVQGDLLEIPLLHGVSRASLTGHNAFRIVRIV